MKLSVSRASPLVRQPDHPTHGHFRIWNRTDGTTSVVDTRFDVTEPQHVIGVYPNESTALHAVLELLKGAA